jgi:hypothetical protein
MLSWPWDEHAARASDHELKQPLEHIREMEDAPKFYIAAGLQRDINRHWKIQKRGQAMFLAYSEDEVPALPTPMSVNNYWRRMRLVDLVFKSHVGDPCGVWPTTEERRRRVLGRSNPWMPRTTCKLPNI